MELKKQLKNARKKIAKKYKTKLCIIQTNENISLFDKSIDSVNGDSLIPKEETETADEKERNLSLISKITQGSTVYLYRVGDELFEIQTDKKMTYRYRTGASTKVHLGDTGALFIDLENLALATNKEIDIHRAVITAEVMGSFLKSQIKQAEKSYQDIIGHIQMRLLQRQFRIGRYPKQ